MQTLSGNVFPRRLDKPLAVAAKASGVWIEDTQGNRFLDASGGAIVVNVGHGRPEIAKAVHDQILAHHYIHPTMLTSPATEELASVLAGHAPTGIERFYFLTSGAEANETAIKLARQIHLAAGRPERFRLISRWKSYHGLTLGALTAMGRSAFRTPYAPMLGEAHHIPAPYCLRCSFGLTYPDCQVRCASALEELILNLGPETVSAFLAETVIGGTLAALAPPAAYLARIREICDRYEVLLILDEVLCGMGRTGRWFACEHYGVTPDILTLGKGLGGGALALSAVGVQGAHFETIRTGSGEFVHGGTYSHHPVAAAAGLAVIDILERENLIPAVERRGRELGARLTAALANHPHVADVRGIGFLWGVEFVRQRPQNTPFARREKVTERLWEAIYRKGVLVYKATGLAGVDGDALLVAPPFVISDDEIEVVVAAVQAAVQEVLG